MTLIEDAISKYQAFFTNLSDEKVEDYRNLAEADVRYRDPMVDAKGIDATIAYMHKWFHDLDGLQFIHKDTAVNELTIFQDWTMKFRIRRNPKRLWELEGVSKVTFNEKGKVIDQIDFWDPSPLFESFPVLGKAVTQIKKVIA